MTPVARWALRAYPPSFRDGYGPELSALVDDLAPSWRHTADLCAGAARAWIRPSFAGADSRRRRLQASVSTVWTTWCVAFLLAPAANKALLDPSGPQVDATVRRLLDVSASALVTGWVVALAGAAVIVGRALVPELRARHWSVLRPVVPAAVLGLIEAAGLVALASAARLDGSRPTPTLIALGSAWLVGLLAFLVSSAFGVAATIRQLHPDSSVLRVPALLAAALSACLTVITATSTAAVLNAGGATLVGAFAPVAAVVAVGIAASCIALVSSARGVLALRA